jgi:REP element-mobilizing transposase RayT
MTPLAYHIIFCAYGFWLPNDPRGSWSTFVGSKPLYRKFGSATKVTTRESLAHQPHNHQVRRIVKKELKFPPTAFTGRQALEVARGIWELVSEKGLVVWACAVMPEHVHLVAKRHALSPERIVASCRARASRRLHEAGLWPAGRSVWSKGKWAVKLETPDEVLQRIRYVERNPVEAGLPPQKWSFVSMFAG